MDNKFNQEKYLVRKKIFSIFGAEFHIFDSSGQVVLFSKMKAFKLKEDIRLYSSEDMSEELFTIQARSIIDFSAIYDVVDTKTGEKIGALKRKGLKSILKDEWIILDKDNNEIGSIKEDSLFYAILRRILSSIIPQRYDVDVNGVNVATFKQNLNPFVIKLNLDFSSDAGNVFDKRLGIAAGILLCAIDRKQD